MRDTRARAELYFRNQLKAWVRRSRDDIDALLPRFPLPSAVPHYYGISGYRARNSNRLRKLVVFPSLFPEQEKRREGGRAPPKQPQLSRARPFVASRRSLNLLHRLPAGRRGDASDFPRPSPLNQIT